MDARFIAVIPPRTSAKKVRSRRDADIRRASRNRPPFVVPAPRWRARSVSSYDPSVDRASPTVVQSTADVSGALGPRTAEVSADIYDLIVREISQLRTDSRVLTLLEPASGNVATLLHILQHGIDLDRVHAAAAAEEYARRLARRDIPVAALLRAYRIGSARLQDWCLEEPGRRTDNASIVSASGLRNLSAAGQRASGRC